MLGRPSALNRVVFNGGNIVEIPLKECHVGRGGDQRVMIFAVGHREWHLFQIVVDGPVVIVILPSLPFGIDFVSEENTQCLADGTPTQKSAAAKARGNTSFFEQVGCLTPK